MYFVEKGSDYKPDSSPTIIKTCPIYEDQCSTRYKVYKLRTSNYYCIVGETRTKVGAQLSFSVEVN